MAMARDFVSFAGPGDRDLPMSEVAGYQPVSRIGEVVMNAFVDSHEFAGLEASLSAQALAGPGFSDESRIVEHRPMFHEWATAMPGMICVARKKKTATFRGYTAAETAVPVISCCACLPKSAEKDYFFAGVCRSKSVRSPDDGIGPSVDEFFTVSIGGMVTVLNTSGGPLHPGDLVEWCFIAPKLCNKSTLPAKRTKPNPRRIGIKMASVSSARVIGRVLSFAKSGEPLDLLLKQ